jgi:hypothetical protein
MTNPADLAGIAQMITVRPSRVQLFDDLDLGQPIYGQVRKVEIIEQIRNGKTYILTRITVSDGSSWTPPFGTLVRVTRQPDPA